MKGALDTCNTTVYYTTNWLKHPTENRKLRQLSADDEVSIGLNLLPPKTRVDLLHIFGTSQAAYPKRVFALFKTKAGKNVLAFKSARNKPRRYSPVAFQPHFGPVARLTDLVNTCNQEASTQMATDAPHRSNGAKNGAVP